MQTIDAIALQCPFTGGNAVFRARALMTLWNDTIDFNDEELCASLASRFAAHEITSAVSVMFYPNPSSGLVTMNYDLGDQDEAILEISNTLGQIVFAKNLNSNTTILALDLSVLNNGIYHFALLNHNLILNAGKISIIK